MLEDRLSQDLKQALLSKDELRVATLRSLKNAVLYAKVAEGNRASGLPDTVVVSLLQKEAKKRQESADLFSRGGSAEKAERELAEKAIIETYLPRQLNDGEIAHMADDAISALGGSGKANLGEVIRWVKERSAGAADGAAIARISKERLGS